MKTYIKFRSRYSVFSLNIRSKGLFNSMHLVHPEYWGCNPTSNPSLEYQSVVYVYFTERM